MKKTIYFLNNQQLSSFSAIVVLLLSIGTYPAHAGGKNHLVLQLRGADIGEMRHIDTDGDGITDTEANCFDVDLFNPATGKQIGTGTDCLASPSVVVDDGGEAPLGANIKLTGTGFFNIGNSLLVVQGLTTVRPVLHPTTRDDVTFTHITGANGDGGVMYGTKRFKKSSGKVRLSGQVDMSRLPEENLIYFDCIFIVDFD